MKHCLRFSLLMLVSVLLCASATWGGNIYYVHWNWGCEWCQGSSWYDAFPTVTQALDVAIPGDEIRVAGLDDPINEAVYTENIVMKPGVKILGGYRASNDADMYRDPRKYESILDGGYAGSVVTTQSGCGPDTVLDGFTIRNGTGSTVDIWGYPANCGGGVCVVGEAASPTISNNVIENNAAVLGGGIAIKSATGAIIEGNIIRNNSCPDEWGISAVYVYYSADVEISRNLIYGHAGTALRAEFAPRMIFSNNVMYDNEQAISASLCSRALGTEERTTDVMTIVNNTIVENTEAIYLDMSVDANVSNNIVAYNETGLHLYQAEPQPCIVNLVKNDFYGNTTDYNIHYLTPTPDTSDNVSLNPGFVDENNDDYHLAYESQCRDTGDSSVYGIGALDIDAQPRVSGIIDIGADEYNIQHVDCDNGDDGNSGSSWALAKKTLTGALAAGAAEIWVKEGTYEENIRLTNGIRVYGGFAGYESVRDERDWWAHKTTISGKKHLLPVVWIESCPSALTAIDGFTLTSGAGYEYPGCDIGYVGGGIFCIGSNPTISHNIITKNGGAADYGGGIYCEDSAAKIIGNAVISNNAVFGSGICFRNFGTTAVPELVNNTIAANGLAAGLPAGGGGVYFYNPTDARIVNNIVAHNNGGIICSGGNLPTEHHHNCIHGNGSYSGDLPLGTNDITTDPVFAHDGFHIQDGSPCEDTGDDLAAVGNDFDIDHQDRTLRVVDIGADEAGDCLWYDLTLDGPDGAEFPVGMAVPFTAVVYDPVSNTYVNQQPVHFSVNGGRLTSISAGTVDPGGVTGAGVTNSSGTVTAYVTRDTPGCVTITASTEGCFGMLSQTGGVCYSTDLLVGADWPMFMHDPQHTGMSTITDLVGDSLNDGVPNWTYAVPTIQGINQFNRPLFDASPVYSGGKVVVGAYNSETNGNVFAFIPDADGNDQGALLWAARNYTQLQNMGGVVATPCIANGKVYVATANGYVYCLNLSDGSPAWAGIRAAAFQSDTPLEGRRIFGSPVVFENVVYVANEANVVYAFNAANGQRIAGWTNGVALGPYANLYVRGTSSPAIAVTSTGAKYLFVGSNDSRIYRVSLTSTPSVTSVLLDGFVESSPTVVGDFVYIGTNSRSVYKLSVTDFAIGSAISTQLPAEVRTTCAADAQSLYVGCDTGTTFHQLSLIDLAGESWFRADPLSHFVGSGALTLGVDGLAGIAYVGNDNGKFYARDGADLTIPFGTYVPGIGDAGWIHSSPAIAYVLDANNHRDRLVYVTTRASGGMILAFKTDR